MHLQAELLVVAAECILSPSLPAVSKNDCPCLILLHEFYLLFLPTSEISRQMDAPDSMVGFILGRGGKVLNRIQSRTQTLIRLSQRGEFRPGTTNRIVTITGTTSESVEHAMDLINERLSSAESIIH
mmetsp:Transcript_11514/g.17598  ORF Transcript_11514/g.17598 Transcript_11514/m.17598 type:complete len:127 (-) Transcript_11514:114-494(-)